MSGTCDDHRGDRLAKIGIGDADHGGFGDPGKRVDSLLDLLRVDVEPTGDDEILGAADDPQIAVRENLAHVPGLEIAAAAARLGFPRGDIPSVDVRCLKAFYTFHFRDADTALINFDRVIYTLKRR